MRRPGTERRSAKKYAPPGASGAIASVRGYTHRANSDVKDAFIREKTLGSHFSLLFFFFLTSSCFLFSFFLFVSPHLFFFFLGGGVSYVTYDDALVLAVERQPSISISRWRKRLLFLGSFTFLSAQRKGGRRWKWAKWRRLNCFVMERLACPIGSWQSN